MDAKKATIMTGAALAGAGVLASRALGPKLHALHEHCQSACASESGDAGEKADQSGCAGNCGHADEKEASAERKGSPEAVRHAA